LLSPGLYESLLLKGLKHDSLTVRGYVVKLLTGDSADLPEDIRGNIFSKESDFIKKNYRRLINIWRKESGLRTMNKIETLIRSK